MRRGPAPLLALLALATMAAACSTVPPPSPAPSGADPSAAATPSASPSPAGSAPAVALACVSVLEDECAAILEGALGALPAGHPPIAVATVELAGCAEPPCLPGLAARGSGGVLVEYVGAAGAAGVTVSLGPDGVRYEPSEAFLSGPIEPRSRPALEAAGRFSLEHCGLWSPIDWDGSLWNPVGFIDGDDSDAINSARGTIRRLGPVEAEFRSERGLVVRLRRHEGPKVYRPCM